MSGTQDNTVAASAPGSSTPDPGAMTVQRGFVNLLTSTFAAGEAQALDAFLKLRAFMRASAPVESLYQSALNGEGTADDTLFERVRTLVLDMNLRAILRQVVMPLSTGYLAYAAAITLELTGGVPILVGLLVGAMIWIAMAPGTWQMIKDRISSALTEIFGAAGLSTPN